MADIPGESKSAWNENKGELFTYHYDTLMDIGKKYNLAWGLLWSEDNLKILQNRDRIPGYDIHKTMFEA